MRSRLLSCSWVIVLGLSVFAVAPASAGAAASEKVAGQWYESPCLPRGTDVYGFYDPVSGRYDCELSDVWTGSLTGATIAHAQGTADLITGEERGTLLERCFCRTADGHQGELVLEETDTVNGATGWSVDHDTIIDGSGDFAGATGNFTFTGTVTTVGNGTGTYTGSWTHPAYGSTPQSAGSSSTGPAVRVHARQSARPRPRVRSPRHRGHHRHGRRAPRSR